MSFLGKKPRIIGIRMAHLQLTTPERVLAARMNGELTVAELAQVTGLPEDTTRALVAKLESEGGIEFVGEPRATEDERETLPEQVAAEEVMPEEPDDDPEEESKAAAERNHRQLYETRWHALTAGERAAAAGAASGADLLALCFDADPQVIAAILENSSAGLEHARLIAQHHRTTTGIEILARRREWLHDLLVERRLLRNPMIGEIVLGRVMNPKRLAPTYKLAIDRDLPEITRVKVRAMIRPKWQTAPPEERADLMLRTEARCLTVMTGCTFDAKTTAILCGRPINSAIFVQSVAKFGAAPPALLGHFMKQAFVRKNPGLKKMLLAHPNLPGEAKRMA